MMRTLGWLLLVVPFLASGLADTAFGAPATAGARKDGTEEALKRMTGELLAAVASGDWAVWNKYLDDSVLYTSEDGRTLTKAQLREELKPLPPGYSGSIEVERAEVRLYGARPIANYEATTDELYATIPEISRLSPFTEREVVLRTPRGITGVLL